VNNPGSDIIAQLNVSRETLDQLVVFVEVLRKWNDRINLVSRSSMDDVWSRHILDSAQLFRCVEPAAHWVDIGTGGGLPGMIVAIMAQREWPDTRVTMIESDQRKVAFLRAAAREVGVTCAFKAGRIESVPQQGANILSARALADLKTLMKYTKLHMLPDGVALFPKGAAWEKEVADAQEQWHFDYEAIKSLTNPQSVILKIKGVSRV